jgi:hypothetical protein
MTADQWVAVIAGAVGGFVGGAAAVGAYVHGYFNIERIERRKQKIDLAQELMATRFAFDANYHTSETEARDINRALARLPFVFSDNPDVIAAFDRMIAQKTDEHLFVLLEKSLEAAGLKQYAVSRSHLARVLTVPAGPKRAQPQ